MGNPSRNWDLSGVVGRFWKWIGNGTHPMEWVWSLRGLRD